MTSHSTASRRAPTGRISRCACVEIRWSRGGRCGEVGSPSHIYSHNACGARWRRCDLVGGSVELIVEGVDLPRSNTTTCLFLFSVARCVAFIIAD